MPSISISGLKKHGWALAISQARVRPRNRNYYPSSGMIKAHPSSNICDSCRPSSPSISHLSLSYPTPLGLASLPRPRVARPRTARRPASSALRRALPPRHLRACCALPRHLRRAPPRGCRRATAGCCRELPPPPPRGATGGCRRAAAGLLRRRAPPLGFSAAVRRRGVLLASRRSELVFNYVNILLPTIQHSTFSKSTLHLYCFNISMYKLLN